MNNYLAIAMYTIFVVIGKYKCSFVTKYAAYGFYISLMGQLDSYILKLGELASIGTM